MQNVPIQSIWRTVSAHRFQLMSAVVLGWSIYYTVTLAAIHNTGPQLYAVLTAVLATIAASSNLGLLRASRIRVLLTAVVIVLWVVVALGGIAGAIAHIVGPAPGHGLVDSRLRPIAAPLVFTLLGSVGGAALVFGQRARMRAAATSERNGSK